MSESRTDIEQGLWHIARAVDLLSLDTVARVVAARIEEEDQ